VKIMVIRHGEKPGDPDNSPGIDPNGNADPQSLTAQGWRRAHALVGLFDPTAPATPRAGLAAPQQLFATEISDPDSSKRPLETLTPLAQALQLPIDASIKGSNVDKLCHDAKKGGGVVLIAWKHEVIPAIAQGLTSDPVPAKWPKERFDMVWVFDLQPNGSYRFSQVPELVLPGDLGQPIPLAR
jgi:hypothetical protein